MYIFFSPSFVLRDLGNASVVEIDLETYIATWDDNYRRSPGDGINTRGDYDSSQHRVPMIGFHDYSKVHILLCTRLPCSASLPIENTFVNEGCEGATFS